MKLRSGLLGLAGILAAACTALAKPTDPPTPPQVEGREPTPLAREFHDLDYPAPARGSIPADHDRLSGPKVPVEPGPLADFVAGIRDAILNHLTIPLGR